MSSVFQTLLGNNEHEELHCVCLHTNHCKSIFVFEQKLFLILIERELILQSIQKLGSVFLTGCTFCEKLAS